MSRPAILPFDENTEFQVDQEPQILGIFFNRSSRGYY